MSNILCGCKGCATARKPLEDAIARVHELHKPVTLHFGDVVCDVCTDYGDYPDNIMYPCDTIKALDGEQ